MKKRLISSYDEVNDTFVGKIDGKNGYCADFGISNGIYLGIDIFNFPTFVLVSRASEVLNIPKQCLESDDVKIDIDCDENCLFFNMFVENSKICSVKCPNSFGIPNLKCLMDSNLWVASIFLFFFGISKLTFKYEFV